MSAPVFIATQPNALNSTTPNIHTPKGWKTLGRPGQQFNGGQYALRALQNLGVSVYSAQGQRRPIGLSGNQTTSIGSISSKGEPIANPYMNLPGGPIIVKGLANGQALIYNGSAWVNSSTTGTGTVTSVALSVPGFLNVAGSPITTAGTFSVTLVNQAAHAVFVGPTSGTGTPTFRALVASDLPSGFGVMTTLGDTIYGGISGVTTRLPGSTSATKNFLTQTGTGSASAAPAWGTLATTDIPSGVVIATTNQTTVSFTSGAYTVGTVQDINTISSPTFAGLTITGNLTATATTLGFFGATAITQPTVTGSKGGNVALASLMTALSSLGLVIDTTT